MSDGPPSLYRIHGLLVESEIPLPAIEPVAQRGRRPANPSRPSDPVAAPDYRVVAGGIRESPNAPPEGRMLAEIRHDGFGYWVVETRERPRRWLLRYAGVCEFTLDPHARTIAVHRSPGGDPGLVAVILAGGVLAHALSAEGLLALHASAVEIGGGALAIVGAAGAGKSTLAALLCGAGARLVADDVLRIDVVGTEAVCFPGSGGLRLRPSAASLGEEIDGAALEEAADGRAVVRPPRAGSEALTLKAVLIPEPSRQAPRLHVERLGVLEGLQELIRRPRLTGWLAPELIGRLFELTAEVAEAVPIYRARIPWGPPFPAGLAEELLGAVGLGDQAPHGSAGGPAAGHPTGHG